MGTVRMVILLVVLAFGSVAMAQTEEFTFQQGIDGYEGGQDVTIYDGDQVNPPAAGTLRMMALWPTTEEVYNTLIRFEGLEVTLGGKQVLSAEIELTYGNQPIQEAIDGIIETYSAGKNWHDPNATWDEANGGLSWDVAGAQGSTDRTVLHSITEMRDRTFSNIYYDGEKFIFALDAAEVQTWVDNPAANNGVLMVMENDVAMTSVLFHSNESTAEGGSYRPLLRVTARTPCASIPGDLNGDCYVNLLDLAQMKEEWLAEDNLTADLFADGIVNLLDFEILARNWLECSEVSDPECDWTGP